MALRTGRKYLESLQDGRNLWFNGERVRNTATHPELGPVAKTLAATYDLHHHDQWREQLTCLSPEGREVSASYRITDTPEALAARRQTIDFWARRSGGVGGRIPDYQAMINTGLFQMRHAMGATNPSWAENIEHWYLKVRDGDLLQTHAFADIPRDRSNPQLDPGYLKIVERTPEGIVLKGAKSIATIAPYADEFLGLTAPRPGIKPAEVLFFALPMATEGMHIICRDSLMPRSTEDHPLAGQWDEMDAYILFDSVFVPNDRIFYLQDEGEVDLAALGQLFFAIINSALWHILARASVKTELLLGLANGVADHLGKKSDPAVMASLAEIAIHLESVRALLFRAEAEPIPGPGGSLMPNPALITAGRVLIVQQQPKILQSLRELCGSGILMSPHPRDLHDSELGAQMREHFLGRDPRAEDRFALLKLAWDLSCDSFGSRQLLFEMLNAGGAQLNQSMFLEMYDMQPATDLAMELAGLVKHPN